MMQVSLQKVQASDGAEECHVEQDQFDSVRIHFISFLDLGSR